MKFVFGPVPSRRLGRSLGIDPIPSKTCNWNCVYCQLGRTRPLRKERREYFPRSEILAEISDTIASHAPGGIDWITFVGSGETTLHPGIGWLIREAKALELLAASGKAQVSERYGRRYWSASRYHYPEQIEGSEMLEI